MNRRHMQYCTHVAFQTAWGEKQPKKCPTSNMANNLCMLKSFLREIYYPFPGSTQICKVTMLCCPTKKIFTKAQSSLHCIQTDRPCICDLIALRRHLLEPIRQTVQHRSHVVQENCRFLEHVCLVCFEQALPGIARLGTVVEHVAHGEVPLKELQKPIIKQVIWCALNEKKGKVLDDYRQAFECRLQHFGFLRLDIVPA